ncbi:hypothetical protein B0H12DRAFT_1067206 [Mycena haematopus]|nr:hypothetical protein B0H12DRAFT_1067206 [Mycena haematopus]
MVTRPSNGDCTITIPMARDRPTRSTISTTTTQNMTATAKEKHTETAVVSWSIDQDPFAQTLFKKYDLALLLPWKILVCIGDHPQCQGIPYDLFGGHRHSTTKQRKVLGPRAFSASTMEDLKIWKVQKSYRDFPRPSAIVKYIPLLALHEGLEDTHPRTSKMDHCVRVMCQSFIWDGAKHPSWWFRVDGVPEQRKGEQKSSLDSVDQTAEENSDHGETNIAVSVTKDPAHHVSDFEALQLFLASQLVDPQADAQSDDDDPSDDQSDDGDQSSITPRMDHWTNQLQWHNLMEKGDLDELRARLKGPTALSQAVRHYISEAVDRLDEKTTLFLEKKVDIGNYVSTWTSFLAMVLLDQHKPHETFPAQLSSEVKTHARKLGSKLASGNGKPSTAWVHSLIMSLLSTNHRQLNQTLEASPLFRFAAVDSHRNDSKIDEATNISSKMGRLQYVFRLCVVWQGLLDVTDGRHPDFETSINENLHLISGGRKLSTWQILQSIKGKASRNTRKEVKDVRIEWSADGKEFLYAPLRQTITMSDLHTFFHDIHNKSQKHLNDIVLKGVPTDQVDALWAKMELHRVVDDITRSDVQYTFLADPRNPFHSDHHYPLLEVLMKSRPGYFGTLSNIPGGCPIQWNVKNVSTWWKNADDTIHDYIMGSWTQTPASWRGTEMAEVKLRIQQDDKPDRLRQIILRAPSKVLGDQLAFYLVYVRPLLVFWAPVACPEIKDAVQTYREYLWVAAGKRLMSQDIGKVLEKSTFEHFQFAISIRDWRHIAIAIIRRHLTVIGMALDEMMGEGGASDNGESNAAWNDSAILREYATLGNRWHRFWGFDREDKASTALYIAPSMDPASRTAVIVDAVQLMKRSVVSLEKKLQYLTMSDAAQL